MIQLSPGVNVSEKDLTNIIPAVATSIGAAVIEAGWGPVQAITTIDSENTLVKTFGKPNSTNAANWFAASNFLAYSNNLMVVRSDTTNQRNAVATTTGSITSIPVTSGGVGYSGIITVNIPAPSVTGGVQATATATVAGGVITGIVITNPGTGYSTVPTVTVSGTNTTPAVIGTVITVLGGVKINNLTDYQNTYANGEGVVGEFAAKYPGSIGNSLTVSMADADAFAGWAYKSLFGTAPGTSNQAAQIGATGDELHVVVIDANGRWSGTAGTVLEKYAFLSKASDARREDGTTSYYKNVLNTSSDYVYWMDPPTNVTTVAGQLTWGTALTPGAYQKLMMDSTGTITATTSSTAITGVSTTFAATDVGSAIYNANGLLVGTIASWTSATSVTLTANALVNVAGVAFHMAGAVTKNLSGGVDHFTATDSQRMLAFDLFNNAESFDCNLIIAGKANTTVATYIIQNIAEARLDCIALISPENISTGAPIIGNTSASADAILAYKALLPSSSYYAIDSGYKYQNDKYNDQYRWVPLNGDVAGLCARTDTTDDPWFSPAGFNRGQIKNVIKLAFTPRQADRDNLYKNGVNPVVSFPGQGTILYGDKTGLAKPSAFDRINVRRLFIVLEKAISTASKYQLFEFNDSFTQAQFVGMVTPFLRDVKGRRGIHDFAVTCDSTNNTSIVIDSNRFVADIYIQAARSINFIQLNFVATRTGVSFSEIAGSSAA